LSSIEVLILDQADVFMMQNWEHIVLLFDLINTIPKKNRGTDFSRCREWNLDDRARLFRQTLIFSGRTLPELNYIWGRCNNIGGKIKFTRPVGGSIEMVVPTIQQVIFFFSPVQDEHMSF
jgi:U3 small nucleolar RNA-associated protein 25